MQGALRFFGSTGSALANLLLFGAVSALWPKLPHCGYALCMTGPAGIEIVALHTFRPYIDNPGRGLSDEKELECPEPSGAGYVSLVDSPLPAGFDPAAYPGRELYACVRVGANGDVEAAHALRGTGSARLDRQVVASIRGEWRFETSLLEGESSWQRIRLNRGLGSAAIYDPPSLF